MLDPVSYAGQRTQTTLTHQTAELDFFGVADQLDLPRSGFGQPRRYDGVIPLAEGIEKLLVADTYSLGGNRISPRMPVILFGVLNCSIQIPSDSSRLRGAILARGYGGAG
jgi:hypothetical protein